MSANPPPREIPKELFKTPAIKAFFIKLVSTQRLLFDNQSGNRDIPTDADEFSRRYALLIRNR